MSSIEFKLPDLGENIEAGEVLSVLVSAGDQLEMNQPVVELETDKAVIEVPSSVSGQVTEVHVSQGDRAAVGQLILTLTVDAEADGDTESSSTETPPAAALGDETPQPPARAPKPAAPPTTTTTAGDSRAELRLPELGEGVDGGDVIGILVNVGDSIAVDQPVIEIEIDKGVVEVPATVAGMVEEIHVKKGDRAAAPSVRRFAREIGIDISQVTGSGPAGRLSIQDVKTHAKGLNTGRTQATTSTIEAPPLPDFTKWGEIEREPISNVRRITANHMARAWATIPHVTQFDKADITQLEVWRKQFAKKAEAAGGKLTPTAIVLKIAAAALRRFPQFCASIDMAGEEVIYKKYCHIGVAVDTPRGLLVPVVRDVDRKNMIELSVELTQIAEKARTGKLAIDDMQGGCFTISNLGGIGGTAFTPIVNAPEVGILGVARSSHEPVLTEGKFEPRLMMPLSLSFDHRLIDGADGARFLRWLCEAVENPFLLALEG